MMDRAEAICYLSPIAESATLPRYKEALDTAIAALREQEQSKWISVKDRLPELGKEVLICDLDNDKMKPPTGCPCRSRRKIIFVGSRKWWEAMAMSERIRYDKATREWFERNWDRETTVMRCECCGLYYKPALGHKCKQKCK